MGQRGKLRQKNCRLGLILGDNKFLHNLPKNPSNQELKSTQHKYKKINSEKIVK